MGGATYLAGLWVAKKVFAYGLGTAYGWPRVYRRLMEANAKVYGRRSLEYAKVRGVVQKGMRLPNEIGKVSEISAPGLLTHPPFSAAMPAASPTRIMAALVTFRAAADPCKRA